MGRAIIVMITPRPRVSMKPCLQQWHDASEWPYYAPIWDSPHVSRMQLEAGAPKFLHNGHRSGSESDEHRTLSYLVYFISALHGPQYAVVGTVPLFAVHSYTHWSPMEARRFSIATLSVERAFAR